MRRGYRGCTFTEAVTRPPGPRALAVTFDDAFLSVNDRALPILRGLGVPATIFVPTKFAEEGPGEAMSWPGIDRWMGGPHEDELRCMSWDQLRALADEGWEIGSHTHSHPRLPALSDDDLHRELTVSRDLCAQRLGRPCTSLAYPFGDHDERVVRAAGTAGYSAAGTLPGRLHRPAPLRWPRVGVYQLDTGLRFAAKSSRAVRWMRAAMA